MLLQAKDLETGRIKVKAKEQNKSPREMK